ncbi:DUF418 domain-containing protein [Aquisalimonas sp.]|uniref:DUF418 domain-containing protein n=1 Tax=unclassified Aquisalimonas TaxID=2644645 RepID=UPI0025C533DF|nr:DUF418 domain-containing protein [Aquisalimonas sp.]
MAWFLLGAAAARMQLVDSIGAYRWPLLATAVAGLAIRYTGNILAQLLFSALWLAVFRQGPLEWLWRWQTQGERPKLLGLGQN